MDKATNVVNISEESCLSIELRAGKDKTATSQLCSVKNDHTTTAYSRSPGKMDSPLPSPAFDSPVRQMPNNLSAAIPSTGKYRCQARHIWFLFQALTTSTEAVPVPENCRNQATKEDDCPLLDYQKELFILEKLNRRTSRKTRIPR